MSGPPTRLITSLQNPTVKFIRSLELRKTRKESGLFVAEGVKVIATARDHGWQPESLLYNGAEVMTPFFRALLGWAASSGAECLETSRDVLAKLSTRDNPQNAIAVFRQRWLDDKQIPATGQAPWVALQEIRDPGNLGTIIRTADASGCGGVMLIGDCCDPYSREAVRASMGSIFNVSLVKLPQEWFSLLSKRWTGPIVGTHLSTTQDYRRAYPPGTLLVMGSEGPGLSEELAAACTDLVRIPMTGSADSLNLAVATALMLYEIQRGRLQS